MKHHGLRSSSKVKSSCWVPSDCLRFRSRKGPRKSFQQERLFIRDTVKCCRGWLRRPRPSLGLALHECGAGYAKEMFRPAFLRLSASSCVSVSPRVLSRSHGTGASYISILVVLRWTLWLRGTAKSALRIFLRIPLTRYSPAPSADSTWRNGDGSICCRAMTGRLSLPWCRSPR